MKKLIALVLAVAMVLSLAACGGEPAKTTAAPGQSTEAAKTTEGTKEEVKLMWAGTSASSSYYALNVALVGIINDYVDGVHVTLMETGGTVDDYKLMRDGEASFAQTSAPNEYCLQNGVGTYDGWTFHDSYDLCFFVPQAYYFVVAKDAGITDVTQLNGKKMNVGAKGTSAEIEATNILTQLGVTPDYYPASMADAVDAFANRQIVGFVKSGSTMTKDSTIANAMTSRAIDIIDFTPEQAAKVNEKYPYYAYAKVDGKIFDLDHDFLTYNANFGFSVSADLDEDLVYRIVKAFDEHLDLVRAAYPGISDDPIALTAAPADVSKIHPGVIKYMKEKGIEVPAARIPN